jgi:hypothetical protein
VRARDGSERVQLALAEFQALLDAASIAEHGLPDVKALIAELKAALGSAEGHVDAGEFLAKYDATHGQG